MVNSMKYIDLTHTFTEEMPVYPEERDSPTTLLKSLSGEVV